MKHRLIDMMLVTLQFGILFALFAYHDQDAIGYSSIIKILSLILLAGGILIGVLGVTGLRNSLTVFPTPKSKAKLVTDGIYKYLRHPMYTGLILIALSVITSTPSLLGIVMFVGLVTLLFIKSSYEEIMLQHKFPSYSEYKKHTGRFFLKT